MLKLSAKPFYLEHSRAETNRKLPNSTPFRRTIPRPKAYECRRTSLLRHPRDRPGGQLAIMLAGVLCPVLAGGTEGKSRIPQPLRRNPQLRAGLPRHLQILSTDATSRKFSRLIVRPQPPPNSSTKASSKAVGPSENIPPLPTEIRVLFQQPTNRTGFLTRFSWLRDDRSTEPISDMYPPYQASCGAQHYP